MSFLRIVIGFVSAFAFLGTTVRAEDTFKSHVVVCQEGVVDVVHQRCDHNFVDWLQRYRVYGGPGHWPRER